MIQSELHNVFFWFFLYILYIHCVDLSSEMSIMADLSATSEYPAAFRLPTSIPTLLNSSAETCGRNNSTFGRGSERMARGSSCVVLHLLALLSRSQFSSFFRLLRSWKLARTPESTRLSLHCSAQKKLKKIKMPSGQQSYSWSLAK